MIKKLTPFIAVCCLILSSCTTDIEVNAPGFQATIDGELYQPEIKKAFLNDDGTLIIQGTTGSEAISFTTNSTSKGIYKLSQQAINKISFFDGESKFISEEQTIGEVVITEIYDNEITGNFFFKNLKNSDGKTISFQNGWFYRLPLENFVEIIDNNNNPTVNPCLDNASLTATINGTSVVTHSHQAVSFGVYDSSIRITASNGPQDIEIVFPIDSTPGQYSLEGSGDYSASYSENDDKSSVRSGTLNVIEHNQDSKCITGTFEFETRAGAEITEGKFEFGY